MTDRTNTLKALRLAVHVTEFPNVDDTYANVVWAQTGLSVRGSNV